MQKRNIFNINTCFKKIKTTTEYSETSIIINSVFYADNIISPN